MSPVTSSRSPWRPFGYHGEQGRHECPVQLLAGVDVPLQDGELVVQDQDLYGLPRLLTHAVSDVVGRNMNRRHMTDDHHGRKAGKASGQSYERDSRHARQLPGTTALAASAKRAAAQNLPYMTEARVPAKARVALRWRGSRPRTDTTHCPILRN